MIIKKDIIGNPLFRRTNDVIYDIVKIAKKIITICNKGYQGMAGEKEYSDENNVDQIIPVYWAILLGVPVWMPEYKHKKPISSLEPKWGGCNNI